MTGFLGARLTVPLIIAIMIILSIGYRRAMQSGSELQLETERSRRPLAGVNSTLTGDLAADPLQMSERQFATQLFVAARAIGKSWRSRADGRTPLSNRRAENARGQRNRHVEMSQVIFHVARDVLGGSLASRAGIARPRRG